MSPTPLARLRSLFDMYSPSPVSRVVVLVTMALGVVLLAGAVSTGSGIGALPFLLLVWANHERFLATLDGLFERHGWFVLAVPLGVFVAKMLMVPPTASDDLLRHIASAFWPGGYADMYVHTALPPVELYPAFDWFVGGLARSLGPAPTMWLMQALAFGAFVWVFVAAARRLLGGHPAASVLTLVALVLVLEIMAGRLMLARPEIFMTTWALAGLLVSGRVGLAAWLATGLASGSAYWLAPLYFPAVLLIAASWRARLGVLAFLLAGWATLWGLMTGGAIVDAALWTFAQVANRIPGMAVSENMSIVNVLLAPQMLALALGSAWAATRATADNRLLWLALYFLLSNQARYGGIVAPLFALHLLSALRTAAVPLSAPWRSVVVAMATVSLSLLSNGIPRYQMLPRFDLPEGSVVLTGFSEATYSTLFVNPGKVKVAPAFEIGAASARVQELVQGLSQGRLDCGTLNGLAFTHLIENTLTGASLPCLTLDATQAGWRLWRVH
ncbi:hypothetical protein [Zeimonas arvi]|uniref:Uncharacterized protein n=1 Tax=Zeimonas arvi TaxID=2498847 RepID=A0A5C8NXV9_9BURK|nr:hypothetical protein [Zeimonas arvi]TXL66069.1 hypothetical protein FHP08_08315 [Zeimonas arvi]